MARHLAVLAAVILAACNPPEPGAKTREPEPLGLGLSSYATRAEVESILAGPAPTVLVNRPRPASDRCGRFDQLSLSFPDREDHGQHGELRATFINDRLLDVRFFPDSFDAYVKAIREAGAAYVVPGDMAGEGPTRSWTYSDSSQSYIAWEDRRLKDEVQKWIRVCG